MADPIAGLIAVLAFLVGLYFGALWQRSPVTGPVTTDPPEFDDPYDNE